MYHIYYRRNTLKNRIVAKKYTPSIIIVSVLWGKCVAVSALANGHVIYIYIRVFHKI